MTQNKAYLVEYQEYNGGPIAFRGSKGQINGKGKIITRKLDFEDVYFVKELKQFNLFSMSQMCDKKNKVLFTDSECLVMSPDFKFPDENKVLLRVPRQNNMYRKKQLAEERAAAIRNKPPTKSQLRSLMMTYLKHKERIADFVPIRSEEDERLIQKMNKKVAGVHEEKVLEEPDSTKTLILKKKGNLKDFWKIVLRHGAECIYYRIFRSDESSRWIKTFSEMVTMFDRLDLEELYNLVMQRFESTTPEGVDLVLWGDLRTIYTLTLEVGMRIHMLAERKYPLTKETLERMMSLKLIAESASESAYNLLRFIQKQIDEYGSYDGSEKDL
ncbi:hypothetical protein Tco_0409400 [Tanacetum coccineum]